METTAILFTEPGCAELAKVQLPELGRGQLVVRTAFSCISPGTEGRVLSGHQGGTVPFPVIPGYSSSGVVVAKGLGTTTKLGQRVFFGGTLSESHATVWGGHVQEAVVAEDRVVAIPAGVSLLAASSAKLAAIAYHGLAMAQPLPHERVVVMGLGPIGFFAALLYRLSGALVAVSDVREDRLAAATEAGLIPVRDGSPFPDGGADIVVDATGAPGALATAVTFGRDLPWDQAIHPRARLVIQGSYATPPVLPYDDAFLREMTILIPRDNRRADVEAVLSFMAQGRLNCEAVVGDLGAPERAAEVYRDLRKSLTLPPSGSFNWAS